MITGPAPRARQLAQADLLRQLAFQIEQGAIYDLHLAGIAAAVDDVVHAVDRRGRTAQWWPRG